MKALANTVVITGSTSGLGRATALACLRRGGNVVVSSENALALEETREAFVEFGDRVAGMLCDTRSWSQVEALLDLALQHYGSIDCWINNAGATAPSGDAALVPQASGESLINVNILGTYNGSIAALRYFRQCDSGRLLNITGRGEKSPVKGAALYAASKAWIRNFTLTLAREQRDSKVQVGTFNPGLTFTDLTLRPQVLRGFEESQLKGLKMVLPLFGDPACDPAGTMAAIALGEKKMKLENQHRNLLLHLCKRLFTGRRAEIDVDAIEPRIVEPEFSCGSTERE